jgi:pyruvate dehydrogenase E1 component alpha subunit
MTCEAVHEATVRALEHVRSGKGPVLLEIRTYRYRGHSMSDPQKYRTKDEVEQYKAQDPIEKVLKTIKTKKYATDAEIEAIEEKIKAIVEESVQFAEDSPFPDPEELYNDVYLQEDYPYIHD